MLPSLAETAAGESTCFFAEVRLGAGDGESAVWERVVLKEAPPPGEGLAQVCAYVCRRVLTYADVC